MRRAVTLILLTLASCVAAPLPTVTVPPQPTASSAPVATVTATLAPTGEPPIGLIHPKAIAVGQINVLEAWCTAQGTVWTLYNWGIVQSTDDDGIKACIERGVV